MTNTTPKPQPIPQPESDRYWEGLKNEEIWLQRSKATGKFQFYPRNFLISDPESGSDGIEWVQASGNAELFTFAIVHAAPHIGFIGDVPYITALVQLEEDVIVPTNIVGVEPEPEALQIGMALKAVFEHNSEGQTLLKFTPAQFLQP
ncbi:MAG: OB-fold domain-containing protein [Chloroflexi bacterium]|nr:OB-fold domain-containing protein [Chloroflexota bacterium]